MSRGTCTTTVKKLQCHNKSCQDQKTFLQSVFRSSSALFHQMTNWDGVGQGCRVGGSGLDG
eukprot:1538024-Karenia_brevis.AAC.1